MAQLSLFRQADKPFGDLVSANPADWPVADDWQPLLGDFFASAVGVSLLASLQAELEAGQRIFPHNPLRALEATPFLSTQVVLLGQDPYPTAGHADGLAFSAAKGRPKSLARIAEVLSTDKPGWQAPTHSNLAAWANQGALLINTALTVRQGKAGSHLQLGWHSLTRKLLLVLAQRPNPPVFMLWGNAAQSFAGDASKTLHASQVLATRHPSYDFHKQFMADGSHFLATRNRVDWWAWR